MTPEATWKYMAMFSSCSSTLSSQKGVQHAACCSVAHHAQLLNIAVWAVT